MVGIIVVFHNVLNQALMVVVEFVTSFFIFSFVLFNFLFASIINIFRNPDKDFELLRLSIKISSRKLSAISCIYDQTTVFLSDQ